MEHQIESGLHKRKGRAITNFKDKLPANTSDLAIQTLKDPYRLVLNCQNQQVISEQFITSFELLLHENQIIAPLMFRQ